jgi:hypothetical protein
VSSQSRRSTIWRTTASLVRQTRSYIFLDFSNAAPRLAQCGTRQSQDQAS